jgi:hypothetical protein
MTSLRSSYQILDNHTTVDVFCLKWTSHRIYYLGLRNVARLECCKLSYLQRGAGLGILFENNIHEHRRSYCILELLKVKLNTITLTLLYKCFRKNKTKLYQIKGIIFPVASVSTLTWFITIDIFISERERERVSEKDCGFDPWSGQAKD